MSPRCLRSQTEEMKRVETSRSRVVDRQCEFVARKGGEMPTKKARVEKKTTEDEPEELEVAESMNHAQREKLRSARISNLKSYIIGMLPPFFKTKATQLTNLCRVIHYIGFMEMLIALDEIKTKGTIKAKCLLLNQVLGLNIYKNMIFYKRTKKIMCYDMEKIIANLREQINLKLQQKIDGTMVLDLSFAYMKEGKPDSINTSWTPATFENTLAYGSATYQQAEPSNDQLYMTPVSSVETPEQEMKELSTALDLSLPSMRSDLNFINGTRLNQTFGTLDNVQVHETMQCDEIDANNDLMYLTPVSSVDAVDAGVKGKDLLEEAVLFSGILTPPSVQQETSYYPKETSNYHNNYAQFCQLLAI